MSTARRTFIAGCCLGGGTLSLIYVIQTLWKGSRDFRSMVGALEDFFAAFGEMIFFGVVVMVVSWLVALGLDALIKHVRNSRACKAAGGEYIYSCWSVGRPFRKIWDESERPYK